MASQCAALAIALPSRVALGFHPPNLSAAFPSNSNCNRNRSRSIRIKTSLGFERRPKVLAATESNSSEEKADAGEGPPFLTILAGFVVLLLLTWISASVLVWLIRQIFRYFVASK